MFSLVVFFTFPLFSSEETSKPKPKSIVIYFSRPGENYINGSIVNLKKGNTKVIAEMIAQKTGSDLFELVPEMAYPEGYDDTLQLASNERTEDQRPEVRYLPDIEEYDVIFLGYPIWWQGLPMSLYTVLEDLDTDKKIIRPFCTHEGSGLSSTIKELKKLCPEAIVKDGLPIQGSNIWAAEPLVTEWLNKKEENYAEL